MLALKAFAGASTLAGAATAAAGALPAATVALPGAISATVHSVRVLSLPFPVVLNKKLTTPCVPSPFCKVIGSALAGLWRRSDSRARSRTAVADA